MTTTHPPSAIALTIQLVGLEAHVVHVRATTVGTDPLAIVGLTQAQSRETSIGVRSALHHVGVDVGAHRVTVHVAPDDVRSVAHLDLPIAVAVLGAIGHVPITTLERTVVLGELSLSGAVLPVRGVLPALRGAAAAGMKHAIVPRDNAREASAARGIEVRVVDHLQDMIRHLAEGIPLEPVGPWSFVPASAQVDMADVRGMTQGRRALEIAAAGGHGLLLIGNPGAGKTMLARRLPTILPPLTEEEALDVTAIHSVASLVTAQVGVISRRPFRAPHHTVSAVGLVGGGHPARPGEVSLAHHGVLFLDELFEFQRSAIESLRHVLDEGRVTTSRAGQSVSFTARPMLVGSINPCGCGYRGAPSLMCTCSPDRAQRYLARLQEPMFERFDLRVCLPQLEVSDRRTAEPGESSSCVRNRVVAARALQAARFGERARTNADLTQQEVDRVVTLDGEGSAELTTRTGQLGLTARDRGRVIRVARTIADLGGSNEVRVGDVQEALEYVLSDYLRPAG